MADTLISKVTFETQQNAQIVSDGNNGYIVIWESYEEDGSRYGIFMRRLDNTGQPIGDDILVNTTKVGSQFDPSIAVSATGSYMIAWVSASGSDDTGPVMARAFDKSGKELMPETVISNGMRGALPDVSAFPDGSFAVTWNGTLNSTEGTLLKIIPKSLLSSFNGDTFNNLSTNRINNNINSQTVTAISDSGNIMAVWSYTDSNLPANSTKLIDLYYRVINKNGVPITSTALLPISDEFNQFSPDITYIGNEKFVVVWSDGRTGDVYAKVFNSDGVSTTGEIAVSTGRPNDFDPAVAPDGKGGFIVTWTVSDQGDATKENIAARRFNTDGQPLSDVFNVNELRIGEQGKSSVATDEVGNAIAVWQSMNTPVGTRYFDIYGNSIPYTVQPSYSSLGDAIKDQWDLLTGEDEAFSDLIAERDGDPIDTRVSNAWKTLTEEQAGVTANGTLTVGGNGISNLLDQMARTIFGTSPTGNVGEMTSGYIYDISYYKAVKGQPHPGIDLDAYNDKATTVRTPVSGEVVSVKPGGVGADGLSQSYLSIKDPDGRIWVFIHLEASSGVEKGKMVAAGDIIGTVKPTAAANLHLEVRTDGAVSPLSGIPSVLDASGNVNASAFTTAETYIKEHTMSPLEAYWRYRQGLPNVGGADPNYRVWTQGDDILSYTDINGLVVDGAGGTDVLRIEGTGSVRYTANSRGYTVFQGDARAEIVNVEGIQHGSVSVFLNSPTNLFRIFDGEAVYFDTGEVYSGPLVQVSRKVAGLSTSETIEGTASSELIDGGGGIDLYRTRVDLTKANLVQEAGIWKFTVGNAADYLVSVEAVAGANGTRILSSPGTGFSEADYLRRNPDVANAVQAGVVSSGLEHWQKFGWAEGRQGIGIFSEEFYLANNPDVAAAVRAGALASGYAHWEAYGRAEGRNPSILYDEDYYLAHNRDVAAAVEAGQVRAIDHFISYGLREGRAGSAFFDPEAYLLSNPDVAKEKMNPYLHFITYGWNEGRLVQVDDGLLM
ncbi:MAG: M23 family metallopeptidase [Niveispirillum sp.]|uniref:M23 family metallopeptidase n=1 Tax=Niveispirillum sp. TaxID=1917217 RepID=UPI0040357B76